MLHIMFSGHMSMTMRFSYVNYNSFLLIGLWCYCQWTMMSWNWKSKDNTEVQVHLSPFPTNCINVTKISLTSTSCHPFSSSTSPNKINAKFPNSWYTHYNLFINENKECKWVHFICRGMAWCIILFTTK